jgi:hypothetical protein
VTDSRRADDRRSSQLPARLGLYSWPVLVVLTAGCKQDDAVRHVTVVHDVVDAGGDAALAANKLPNDTGGICRIDDDYLTDRKDCTADSDCVVVAYHPSCCSQQVAAAVNVTAADEVRQCVKDGPPACFGSNCGPEPDRAEDGRASVIGDFRDVVARCVAGQCQSSVSDRMCGMKHNCSATQVCIEYGNVPGGTPPDPDSGDNAFVTYTCVDNPCAPKPLACECAQAACNLRKDATRSCQIELATSSDVACVVDGT